MPDNESQGELEEFIAELIGDWDIVWPLAVDYVDRIPSFFRDVPARKDRKAKVLAWLATRKYPGEMGGMFETYDLDLDWEPGPRFANWIRKLFA